MEIREQVSAARKLGAGTALELAADAGRVIVMKGKKVTSFNMNKDKPTEADLLKIMLGATGNLRAPTVRRGKTVLVGFNAEIYADILG